MGIFTEAMRTLAVSFMDIWEIAALLSGLAIGIVIGLVWLYSRRTKCTGAGGHGRLYIDGHGELQYSYEERPQPRLSRLAKEIIEILKEGENPPSWAIDAGRD